MLLEQWKALAARIRGFIGACELCGRSDSTGTLRNLRIVGLGIIKDLQAFLTTFKNDLPARAVEAIEACAISDRSNSAASCLVDSGQSTLDTGNQQVWMAIVLLSSFESEMTYLLADGQTTIRSRTERAFTHLQRLLVADDAVRAKWIEALGAGETVCEKYGAVHLLGHGIWAFKVTGTGERTDLVFQEPLNDFGEVRRAADGLVLTEWKVCREPDSPDGKFREARDQAQRYSTGVLAGVELTTFRYAVVVSKDFIDTPADLPSGSVTWRHINIAVQPSSPSVSARRG